MADDDTEPRPERSKLEAPKLFSRRRQADEPVFDDAATEPVPVPDDGEPVARPGRRRRFQPGPSPVADTGTDTTAELDTEPSRRRRLPTPSVSLSLPPRAAAAVSGALSGLAMVVLVWLGFRACELVRGTSSCGTAPGMVALVVIFVLTVVVGALLLRLFAIPEQGVTSFLGVGLTAVVALIALVDVLDSWTMVIVIPAVTALTFLGSWWLSTTYIDPS